MKTRLLKWSLVLVGKVVCALGVAVLVFDFLVWVGTGLDKQAFDAGTVTFLAVLGVMGVLLILTGAKVVKRANKSAS
jgi:uncharacterized membrane protein